jgi:hypothetical protein
MALVLTQPPKPPRTGNQVIDDYLFEVYRWLDKLWRILGRGVEAAALDVSGSATSVTSVTVTDGVGVPEGTATAAAGSFYTDTSTGIVYVKASGTGHTGWRQLL